ncbi:MAG TPA: hypothetical protein VGK06_08315 [Methanosarcina sp.]|jgi:predicted RNA-binding protein (virulence factor B family)
MSLPMGILKKLESLECQIKGRDLIEVFVYHANKEVPYLTPEDPSTWQQEHPKGQASILQRGNFRID